MTDLIARLEAATEGSRELDALVAEAAGWEVGLCGTGFGPIVRPDGSLHEGPLPHFTTNTDMALTLVPEGLACTMSVTPKVKGATIWKEFPETSNTKTIRSVGSHDSPFSLPLAIVIAALRARSAP